MNTVKAADLPTLSQAYAKGQLNTPKSSDFEPSAAINEKVSLWQGDITSLEVDGIQNAANEALRGGGGIDGAIHRAAGPDLLRACRALKGCKTGNTKITKGYELPSRYVLHTVGPIYDDDDPTWNEEMLEGCYKTTLQLAVEHELRTVALCGVSTGVYGYPLEDATEVALRTTREFLDENHEKFERVIFCNFGNRDVRVYTKLAPLYFPPSSEELPEADSDGEGSTSSGRSASDQEESSAEAKEEGAETTEPTADVKTAEKEEVAEAQTTAAAVKTPPKAGL